MELLSEKQARRSLWLIALLFALGTFAVSWWRWSHFLHRTFDLAFYTQALWGLVHGRSHVSLLNVPLLGEHASLIVFPMAPLFALIPHPMLLVALQSAALATMAPVGFRVCRKLGLGVTQSAMMGLAGLIAPASGFVALHEFHPEAFAAPFLMLLFDARLRGSLGAHWLWFLAVLSCKENMPLLLIAYCLVSAACEFRKPTRYLVHWYALPMFAAGAWLVIYGALLSPWLNAGNVEFTALYSHLGTSPSNVVARFFTEPQRALGALRRALTEGNLLWALVFPFLLLPLLRPRWLVIAAPILLQHLLSWRASEWNIYFHYAAPLLPIFWIATAETVAICQRARWLPFAVFLACLTAQAIVGPARTAARDIALSQPTREAHADKLAMLEKIPANASVMAPLPYLSHLALRENLFSLHQLLKGLRTLARTAYQPPPSTDFVLIDYDDTATFDPSAGYFHPTMRAVDGRIYPSSEKLLHNFLAQASWSVESRKGMTLFRKLDSPLAAAAANGQFRADLDPHTRLVSIEKSSATLSTERPLILEMLWSFVGEREWIPWMALRFSGGSRNFIINKGLSAPEGKADGRIYRELWEITRSADLPAGEYQLDVAFFNRSRAVYQGAHGGKQSEAMQPIRILEIGSVRVE